MKKTKNKKLLLLTASYVIITSLLAPIEIKANTKYNIVLETGSQVLEVEYYNPTLWEEIISTNTTPSDWFEGNSDCIGSQSKYTNLWKLEVNEITFTIFKILFFNWFNIPYIDVLKQNGYDNDYITSNYPDIYDITHVYNRYWAFRNQPFNDFPYERSKDSILFMNISDFSKNMMNYNNFALIVNNDPVIQALDVHLPILNSEEYVWRYLVDCPVIPLPITSYLEEVVSTLSTENITIQDKKIIFNRTGIEPYTAEISFTELGKIESIEIYDSLGISIFKIVSFLPKIPLLITLGCTGGIIIVLITVYMLKRSKRRKIV